jgi:hypothetical protein
MTAEISKVERRVLYLLTNMETYDTLAQLPEICRIFKDHPELEETYLTPLAAAMGDFD